MAILFNRLYLRFGGVADPLIDVDGNENQIEGLTILAAPSGCGKTSFFRLLCGWFIDRAIQDVEYSAEMALSPFDDFEFVGGHSSLFPWIDVGHNLQTRSGCSVGDAQEELVSFGCDPAIIDLYPYELSQGMYKRVELAAALLRNPKILLLDEVFSSIDAENRMRAFERIAILRSDAPTIVSSHVDIGIKNDAKRMEFTINSVGTITGIEL